MTRPRMSWKQVTPRAYRRPRRPGRRVVLVATGLALSTVVAGLAVLGSLHPTPPSATSPAHARPGTTSARPGTAPPGSGTSPATAPGVPSTGTRALVGYAYPPPVRTTGAGYTAPTLTPTSAAPPPPPPPATPTSDTYTMTYDSGTVVIIYPGGGGDSGGGGGDRGGGGHHH